ncbi:putative lipoprotein [Pseudovibrio sp. Ad13]|nr:putative lipoprotein [Pseudovibrio sp. Ad13]
MSGAGSQWQATGEFKVGNAGTGDLNIADGGTVIVVNDQTIEVAATAGSSGSVSITGSGSRLEIGRPLDSNQNKNLYLGREGTATLTISDGGEAFVASYLYVAPGDDASGSVDVSGTGSLLEVGDRLNVGNSGTGNLTIRDGGKVISETGHIGSYGDGSVTVSGAGSLWQTNLNTNINTTYLAFGGTARLTIEDGGKAATSNATFGVSNGGSGAATVTGSGSLYQITNSLLLGFEGAGVLTISDDGTVEVGGDFFIARNAGSTGALNIGAAAGEAAASVGTLDTAAISFGASNGSINFNHTDADYVFAPVISGKGTVNQLSGTTVLATVNAGFTGNTAVS